MKSLDQVRDVIWKRFISIRGEYAHVRWIRQIILFLFLKKIKEDFSGYEMGIVDTHFIKKINML